MTGTTLFATFVLSILGLAMELTTTRIFTKWFTSDWELRNNRGDEAGGEVALGSRNSSHHFQKSSVI